MHVCMGAIRGWGVARGVDIHRFLDCRCYGWGMICAGPAAQGGPSRLVSETQETHESPSLAGPLNMRVVL
jgi:hypothetical protein